MIGKSSKRSSSRGKGRHKIWGQNLLRSVSLGEKILFFEIEKPLEINRKN